MKQILVKKSVNEKCTRCWHKVEELEKDEVAEEVSETKEIKD